MTTIADTEHDQYAWIIDCDHLYDPENASFTTDEAGTVGPIGAHLGERNASRLRSLEGEDLDNAVELAKIELSRNYPNHHQFRMYDDDGELYYTGTLYWSGPADEEPEEQWLYGPLNDFGTPNAGAVRISYTGKPEWDIG